MVGGAIPGAAGPGFYKKVGWASHEMQVSKQRVPFMASASASASGILPCLSSYPDFLQWWTAMPKCKPNELFPPNLLFGQCLVAAIETQIKTRNMCLIQQAVPFLKLQLLCGIGKAKNSALNVLWALCSFFAWGLSCTLGASLAAGWQYWSKYCPEGVCER